MLSRVTAKNVGDVFLRHTVYHNFYASNAEQALDTAVLLGNVKSTFTFACRVPFRVLQYSTDTGSR